MLSGVWLGIDLILLQQTLCRPQTQEKLTEWLQSQKHPHPWCKRRNCLLKQTHNIPQSSHPAGEIMDYLHMQLRRRKMNEEHLSEAGLWGKNTRKIQSFGLCCTNTRVCWGIRGGCCVRGGGHSEKVKKHFQFLSVSALCTFQMCCGFTRPGLRQEMSTSSSSLLKTTPVAPSAAQ